MIGSREDLQEYLEADKRALGITKPFPFPFVDEVWKYEIALQKREFYHNVPGILHGLMHVYWRFRHHRLGVKLGLQVPVNTCGKGLRINHFGLLVINPHARIGEGFNVHQGVNIGSSIKPEDVPIIGDNVFVGPGAKLFGKITIADHVAVAAGAVVNKSFTTPNVTIGGVPAKIINSTRGNPYDLDCWN